MNEYAKSMEKVTNLVKGGRTEKVNGAEMNECRNNFETCKSYILENKTN